MTRLDQLMKYLGDAPNDSFLLFAIAKEYEGSGDFDNAFTYYNRLVVEHSDYVGTYYHLGKLYEKIDNIEKAIETYKLGMNIAHKQGDKHAYGELATAKMNIDDDDF
jgi:tetratricopeptide (TPR) repeat protein